MSDDDRTVGPLASIAATHAATPTTGGPIRGGRFVPGAVIAGRYRLVALLGKGGMGEVYRAEDLTLDHPVALKFLAPRPAPDAAGGRGDDVAQLAQFHNELRIARQVSHKNVCRVYDLGEADERRFLTMEYVDGEDLASLLRRIGRLPEDKAIEIARQLCAGLSAAHERGVVHRDLKPANVMIDGDGNVRITDFGLAVAAADGDAARAGTPQYMAPEQLAGQPATIRSDIYALGLILFEIFTGKRTFDAKTMADLIRQHESGAIATPSSVVRDLDPAVERVILRCLEKDPARRPASALAVAAALPGANPLADALAAGETPSPELLAAAGEQDALGVARGLAAFAVIAAGLAAIVLLSPRTTLGGLVPLEKPPAVLADRAQQIIGSLGYTERAADTAYSMSRQDDFLRYVAQTDQSPTRWNTLKTGSPAVVRFWYRTSPRPLVPERAAREVSITDPPLIVSGMTLIKLDTRGRLQEFTAVPPQFERDPEPATGPKWDALFGAAGLQMERFAPAEPQWTPRDFADVRAAWEGPLPDHPDVRVRVEAASYRGRPVSFLVAGPWTRSSRMAVDAPSTAETVLLTLIVILVIALCVAGLLLARHNVRARRADTAGAARLVVFVLIGSSAAWLVAAHHVPDAFAEMTGFSHVLAGDLFTTGVLWILYLALEPYVRRFWPDAMLGWTRLISGRLRDPRVGRDVLASGVIVVILGVGGALYAVVPPLFGKAPDAPLAGAEVFTLVSLPALFARVWDDLLSSLFVSMFLVLGFVVLRLIFRRMSIAVAVALVLFAVVQGGQVIYSETSPWIAGAFQLFIISTVTVAIVRYGLLTTVVALTLANVLNDVPLTPHVTHWTGTTSNLAIAFAIGVAAFGYYASRGGEPLFGDLEV